MTQAEAYEKEYRNRYRDKPLEDIIVFRSGPMPESYTPGMDFDDNARALFEYALQIQLNDRYALVWFVKDPAERSIQYREYKNVSFISYEAAWSEDPAERDVYYRSLCLARYIFMTDTYGFALQARPDQIRVMLWHGCGFKTRLGFASNEDHYEYMTVTGDEYARTYARVFGLRDDQMLVTGYPKADYLFHPVRRWKEMFDIPEAASYIFWLPTFRNTDREDLARHDHTAPKGDLGLPVLQSAKDLEEVNAHLAAKDTVLVIKLHPFQNRKRIRDISRLSHIRLLENADMLRHDIQINQLLGHAEALISDYSSAAVDYLVLDRPVAMTLDDIETYEKERGFFWEDVRPWLPGYEIYGKEDFVRFLDGVMGGADPGSKKRHAVMDQMQKYRDDKSAQRVLEALGIRA
ncbi:MAG: CDP-glycerol glycerophosphotransferase family protein [Lachnospiraceae bacterium]|nr:CDP-glycerol glycerophosphotransferase family protein [Lachnospiraceae bacterium]